VRIFKFQAGGALPAQGSRDSLTIASSCFQPGDRATTVALEGTHLSGFNLTHSKLEPMVQIQKGMQKECKYFSVTLDFKVLS
jgi:hypothetical protein